MKTSQKGLSGSLKEVQFLGLHLLTGWFDEVAGWMTERIFDRPPTPWIVTHININNYCRLKRSPSVAESLLEDCVMVMDGVGMKAGALLLGLGWLPDLNGTDLFPLVMDRVKERSIRIFLLGSKPGTARKAAEAISRRYPGIEISDFHHGYFEDKDESSIVSRINSSRSDLLLAGMGFPKQESFAMRNRYRLETPLVWNVGGLFDFISGEKPRAPYLLRKIRTEWLFRLALDPKTMWRRNVVEAPLFFIDILKGMAGRHPRWKIDRRADPTMKYESKSRPADQISSGKRM
ncbi:MAG: WecB/TagA/CpsF family glycosyltransferase [Candidatus Krumholzibacteriota bacterium]|nr:WecB/TagA/CpsF family glycosyltransferase [Candidatus Krumholzibacteriota bacterium]